MTRLPLSKNQGPVLALDRGDGQARSVVAPAAIPSDLSLVVHDKLGQGSQPIVVVVS